MSEPLYINGAINPKLQVRDAQGRVKKIPKEVIVAIHDAKVTKKEARDEVCDTYTPRNAHIGV